MRFPILRLQTQHKFVRQLKKYLNEILQLVPPLEDSDLFDKETEKAIVIFKKQWIPRLKKQITSLTSKPDADLYTWSLIGEVLGAMRLREELSKTKDYELRTLLLGMNAFANEVSYYTEQMEACDKKIASIFGGKNAISPSNGFEPEGIALLKAYQFYRGDIRSVWRDGSVVIGEGHLSRHMMHLYGSIDGTRFGVGGRTYTDIYS